ncbi:unnamed protein product [Rotaria magnacalcarata]|nr:unnamed protein product [Rotaria magnacalcarata]
MPDVGSLRIKANEQRNLPRDKRDYDLEETATDDLVAYEFSFFVNNVLASLVVNCSDEKISIRALKQMHRLTTINLYCQSLASCHMSAPRMIKNITADQWTQQSLTTIQFVIKQISKKIQRDGIELVEPKKPSDLEINLNKYWVLIRLMMMEKKISI